MSSFHQKRANSPSIIFIHTCVCFRPNKLHSPKFGGDKGVVASATQLHRCQIYPAQTCAILCPREGVVFGICTFSQGPMGSGAAMSFIYIHYLPEPCLSIAMLVCAEPHLSDDHEREPIPECCLRQ